MSWYDWISKLWGSKQPIDPGRSVGEPTEDHPTQPALSLASDLYDLRVGVVSDTGNVREHNEDNFSIPGRVGPDTESSDTAGREPGARSAVQQIPGLFIVADGMGGQNAGERASEMAVTIVPAALAPRLSPNDDEKATKHAIREAVAEANKEVLAQSHLIAEFANMGTTLVLALFRGNRVFVSGIGDSRAYRLRDGKLERLTRDHSLADALGEAGSIRPEEVEHHKFRNVLYLYLGCKEAREGPEEIHVLDVRPGDQFLLTTDGLTGVVRDDTIAEILQSIPDPQRAARALVNRALENRSRDNITCVVIHVQE